MKYSLIVVVYLLLFQFDVAVSRRCRGVSCAATGPTAATATTEDPCAWGYEQDNGPDTWGTCYSVCGNGQSQSPIDLPKIPKTYQAHISNDPNAYLMLNLLTYPAIEYSPPYFSKSLTGELSNTGLSVKFGKSFPNDFLIKGKPYGNEVYMFLQLHFHWGSTNGQGSEHTIGGKSFPLELHMVHVNIKYINEDGTLNPGYASNKDGLAVLGFLYKKARRPNVHDGLESIIEGMKILANETSIRRKGDRGIRADATDSTKITVNFADLIQNNFMSPFYTYSGSLTTPGCNEVVSWVVFTRLQRVSINQLQYFRKLKDKNGNPLVDTYRPPQPLNGRIVGYGNFI